MSNPVAVIISDVHYSIQTLELADAATQQAIAKANQLNVPVIVAGDLHDTKANMRAECVDAMVKTFKLAKHKPILLRGNHCSVNEKSIQHSLTFLEPYCEVIADYKFIKPLHFIAYQHTPDLFKTKLSYVPKGATIIMHQGVHGSKSGEYLQDKSAIPKEWLIDYRVISGHYHTRQDIKCGRPRKGAVGLMSYIGNPYTLNFGEANDPEKGFQILMDDGSLQFVKNNNLRKHVIIEAHWKKSNEFTMSGYINSNDLVKFKVKGTKENLATFTKEIAKQWLPDLQKVPDFKLELMPLGSNTKIVDKQQNLTQHETLDEIITSLENTSIEQKQRLKDLWRQYADNKR
jgi:DNA repair exonuclease SbcCD nuclease subunit